MKAALVSALIVAAGAANSQTLNPRSIPVNGQAGQDEIPFSVIQFGSSNTYPDGGAFVLPTRKQWRSFLSQIGDTGRHPVVDWKTQQLIVVQLAPSSAAVLGFRVARLRQRHGEVDVEIVLNKPYGAGVAPHQPRTVRNQVSPYEVLMTKKFSTPLKTVIVEE